jgi:N-acetylglucosaminyl-diphospho-decaprenol L-rhamnosyltransferase
MRSQIDFYRSETPAYPVINESILLKDGVLGDRFEPVALKKNVLKEERLVSVQPAISIIIINYNGAPWLDRCLASIRSQTIFDQVEVILADNASPDRSSLQAVALMRDWPLASVIQYNTNFGYAGGNDLAAAGARGRYLLFLNNDTWMEPDCLERLLSEMENTGASAATPLVMDYMDNRTQSIGELGFDIFGFLTGTPEALSSREIFVACGPAVMVEASSFRKLGGFDKNFFMYAEEYDLCWKVWLSGGKVILARSARVHHRGSPTSNPSGSEKIVECRTCDSKRFYANRNNLLVLLKNSRHLLLLLVPLQILLLTLEALVIGVALLRWSYIRTAYIEVLIDCWRLRRHILAERRRVQTFRQRGDFWMLRFLRPGLNRWRELKRFKRFGPLKIDSK